MTYVATIDAGGSGVKLGIVSLETWRTVASVRREYAAVVREPRTLRVGSARVVVHHRGCARRGRRRGGRAAGALSGVICTGMRIPFVLVDDRCEPLAPGVLVPDVRGRVRLEEAREAVGADALYATTGHWSAPHFGLPKLLWYVRERCELWKRTRWVLQFCDWLLERLCGVVASERWSASMSQLLDVSSRAWATAVLDATGIDADRLPPLRAAGSLAGGLRPDVARRVGLLPGTPVHVGGGDTHLASHGAGALERDSVTVVAGTTTPIMLATPTPLLDPHVRPLVERARGAGRWAAETNVGTSGAMLRWLRDLSGERLTTRSTRSRAPSPLGARGAFVCAANPEWGARRLGERPADLARRRRSRRTASASWPAPVLESSAHAVACNLARLESLAGEPLGRVVLTGGGGRSPFSAQLLADVLGRRVVVPELETPRHWVAHCSSQGSIGRAVQPPMRVLRPGRRSATPPTRRSHAALRGGLRRLAGRGRGIRGVKPLLVTADLTAGAIDVLDGELGYEVVDRRGMSAGARARGRRRPRRGRLGPRGRAAAATSSSRPCRRSLSSPASAADP